MWVSTLIISGLKLFQIITAGCVVYLQIFEWLTVYQLIKWENLMALNKIIYRSKTTIEEAIILYNNQEIKIRRALSFLFVAMYIFYIFAYVEKMLENIESQDQIFIILKFSTDFADIVMWGVIAGSIKSIVFNVVFVYIYINMLRSMKKCHNFNF